MQFVGIQYLRGIAALAVVLFHIATFVLGHSAERTLAVGGLSAGVDIFFVISGFIIWRTTDKPGVAPLGWWRGRLIRIVPLYWFALALTLALKQLLGAHMPGVVEAIKAFAFIPVLNSADQTMTPFLSPGWTLNYEFAFYGIMALALNLPRRWQRGCLLGSVFVGLVALRSKIDPLDPIQFRMTSPLFFEFLAGIVIAVLTRVVPGGPRTQAAGGIFAVASAVLFYTLVTPRMFPDGPRFIYFGVPAGLLVLAAILLEPLVRQRVLVALKRLGDSSYSLYLIHPLVLMAGFAAFADIGIPRLLIGILLAVLCVAAGLAMHRYIERPLLEAMNRHFSGNAVPKPG